MQAFLQHFGYLPPDTFGVGLLDDRTSEALALYQNRHGLPATGVFDEATRADMSIPRCGMADLDNGIAFVKRCAWPTPQLTFAFAGGTADTAGELAAVRRAIATWTAAAPFTCTEVGARQSPDVLIDWRPAADSDRSMVGDIIAHADFPPGCGVITDSLPKPLHFDDSEHQWGVGAIVGTFDVETVSLHEFGHIMGLQHNTVMGSVMFNKIPSNSTNRVPRSDDLAGIASLYPTVVPATGTFSSADAKPRGRPTAESV